MIFDVEADGLLDEATKIHVFAYREGGEVKHTHYYDEMRDILSRTKLLLGHNIIPYDIPLLEKILGIKIQARVIDTLPLSWYLNHKRVRHGLEWYGVDYGVPKPKIDDWHNLSPEEYAHRCKEDVKINTRLWQELKAKLLRLYGSKEQADRIIDYLAFKMGCVCEQERSRWKLDKELSEKTLEQLYQEREGKTSQLVQVMPMVPVFRKKEKPSKPFKKDGSLSVTGAKWANLLRNKGLPSDYEGEVKEKVAEVAPKPSSHQQIKDWLFSLGWVPHTFKYEKDEFGNERKIPQVRVEEDGVKVLCSSVKKLIDDNPSVGVLDGLTVIGHRISTFEGFLKNHKEGYLQASAGGLTNTLRFKHRVLVNLPGVDKPYGKAIRGSLVARDGLELCGSDMVSLEETTKKHFMFPYDPDFVHEMSQPDFDAHLDLAKHAGAVTQQEIDDYVGEVPGAKNLKPTRKNFKAANYACIYGVGPPKLARETGLGVSQARTLIKAYWARNWAVEKLCEDVEVKSIDGEMWLFNPVSKFWYSLRNKKDVFSTLNQGTGVYCFDKWITAFREKRNQLTAQFHDEVVLEIKKGNRGRCEKLLKEAIEGVNDELQLNVKLDVDIQFGCNYAEIH